MKVGVAIWGRGTKIPSEMAGRSLLSKLYSWLIQVFTKSPYVHVGIYVEHEDGDTDLYEAVVPRVVKREIEPDEEFFFIELEDLEGEKAKQALEFLESKVGKRYGIIEAMLSVLKISFKYDEIWFCSELVSVFLEEVLEYEDLELVLTPTDVVQYLLTKKNKNLYLRKE